MDLLLYSSRSDADEQKLIETIKDGGLEVVRTVDHLKARLNVPSGQRKIVMIFTRDDADLSGITKVLELFSDLLIIMVLHKQEPETLKAAHRLRPRYVSIAGDNFQDIAAILKRMIERRETAIYKGARVR